MTWRSSENNVGVLLPVAGVRQKLQLLNGKLGKWLTITIDADVAISVAVITSIRNRGLAAALLDEILLVENGENRWELTGKALAIASEANAPSSTTKLALTSTAIGNTHIRQTIRMFFRWPMSARPDETAYIERDQRQGLFFGARLVADPVAALCVKGGATVAVTNIAVQVTEDFHVPDTSTVAPYFIPTARQTISYINGAVSKQQEFIRTPNNIRAMVISQEVDGNEVSDIINSLTLRGDTIFPIGPSVVPFSELLAESEYLYGGAVRPANDSHLFLGFQEDGLLSNSLSTRQDTNLRLEYNAQPSAVAGQSQVRVTFFELEHTPGITSPVPFPY